MSQQDPSSTERLLRPAFSWLGFLLFGAAALRTFTYNIPGGYVLQPADLLPRAGLLAAILLLLLSDPRFFRRFKVYPLVYFPLQAALIQSLGTLPPYQDMWGLLYIMVCVQAFAYLPGRWALALSLLYAAGLLGTLAITIGPTAGPVLGLTILAGGALIVSYEVAYKQLAAGVSRSEKLLAEQEEANRQLQAYADRIEALSAAQERDRLAQKLHDSISQTIFSISLMAQSIRVMQDKDPSQVVPQLETLQELTSGVLAQMRALIQQWRPPPEM